MEFGHNLVHLSKLDILKVFIVLIIVISPIVGFYIGINIPSSYKLVCINYKFVKDGNYYIIGETTTPTQKRNGKIDIYKVDKENYEKFLEGFEYSISTKGKNHWNKFYKSICDFKPIIYD